MNQQHRPQAATQAHTASRRPSLGLHFVSAYKGRFAGCMPGEAHARRAWLAPRIRRSMPPRVGFGDQEPPVSQELGPKLATLGAPEATVRTEPPLLPALGLDRTANVNAQQSKGGIRNSRAAGFPVTNGARGHVQECRRIGQRQPTRQTTFPERIAIHWRKRTPALGFGTRHSQATRRQRKLGRCEN